MGSRSLFRALFLGAAAGSVAVLALAPDAFADALSPESSSSENARQIDSLYWWIMAMAAVVFVGVEGILFYSLWKFRARRGRVAAQIHGNTQLEIGWTVGAAVILVFITAITFIKLGDIKNPAATGSWNPAGNELPGLDLSNVPVSNIQGDRDQPPPPGGKSLNIEVNGQQYVWRFKYPALDPQAAEQDPQGNQVFGYEEMVVPENTTVTLDISADDVAHSWWIPKLGGKYDALPGYVNKGWFKAPIVSGENRAKTLRLDASTTIARGDVYTGQCAELCGRNHAQMLARVRVVPAEDFVAWYEHKLADIKEANKAAQEYREAEAQEREQAEAAEGAPGTEEEEVPESTIGTPEEPESE